MSPLRYKFLGEVTEYLESLGYLYIELPEGQYVWTLDEMLSDKYYTITPRFIGNSTSFYMKLEVFQCLDIYIESSGGIIEDLQQFFNRFTDTAKILTSTGFEIIELETINPLADFITHECDTFKCLHGSCDINIELENHLKGLHNIF